MKVFLDASLLIHLNTAGGNERQAIAGFFQKLLHDELFLNVLVIDETLYVSKSRYLIPYPKTFQFLKQAILPFCETIPLTGEDVASMAAYIERFDLKPSDALHLSTMEKKAVRNIASEDQDFDRVGEVKRVWLD